MKYNNKEIKEMTDLELDWAKSILEDKLRDVMERRQHPKFQRKMINQPEPPVNPAFLQLQDEINKEIEKRQNRQNPNSDNKSTTNIEENPDV